mmetsp:Transcript_5323/g.15456  ORF Transcript_5323/g.15456 Transcript_5323/m.15456 type:complete len:509 (+) Transcript_5323:148-1674(+)|eukprot:CAMPEP_0172359776 /NCGR_PEP_ID=MMETSP1060-20121228/3922_1 /TAXON_ID=37318 /ORGANISM="Pseudo-nitzschia pungens, Strain cf. cingulata" /LENGTH=508 /DNA_ID=CAMNT_0013081563 /DNA_START=110 /DNA_END=1636 /DNA_ORIENTATION=-
MPKDLTQTHVIKRSTKKKSGYTVTEEDDGYVLESAPARARVAAGDKIVAINGIPAGDFEDEDEANDLIESLRIVVVPRDKLEEYDGNAGDEESEEESSDEEEPVRARGKKALLGKPKVAGSKRPVIFHCDHCGVNNEDLRMDEDGDYVCEECGHVIDPPHSENDTIMVCSHCNEENRNLEPDEEGDYVCQNCGCVIPQEDDDDGALRCEHCNHINENLEPDEDGDLVCESCGHVIDPDTARGAAKEDENPKKNIYVCPDCNHENINPEVDEEGDRVCEECGCILPEKEICVCEVCKHENVDPQPNENGEYVCEHCESALDIKKDDSSSSDGPKKGQQFDENGKPITNKDGKPLTPADMFEPGDVITVNVTKSNKRQDPGLKVEKQNGKYYVRKVPSGGLFAKTPVIPGDKLLEINGIDSHEVEDVNEIKKILKEELKITIVVERKDPDASESSASSVDYQQLKEIKPNPKLAKHRDDDDDTGDTEEDEDTAPYDGEDCGCAWCPNCNE